MESKEAKSPNQTGGQEFKNYCYFSYCLSHYSIDETINTIHDDIYTYVYQLHNARQEIRQLIISNYLILIKPPVRVPGVIVRRRNEC